MSGGINLHVYRYWYGRSMKVNDELLLAISKYKLTLYYYIIGGGEFETTYTTCSFGSWTHWEDV